MTHANQAIADVDFEGRQRRPSLGKIRNAFGTWFSSALERWRKHREQKRWVRQLREINDHTLKDIGIDRTEIVSMVLHGRSGRRSRA